MSSLYVLMFLHLSFIFFALTAMLMCDPKTNTRLGDVPAFFACYRLHLRVVGVDHP